MKPRAVVTTCTASLLALAAASCADKGISPTSVQFNPKIALQVTITADQQVGFGPRFLIAAAGFDGEGHDDGGFLGFSAIPYVAGTHTLTVPVDLAPCLAYYARKGKDACKLLIGAAIVPDTDFVSDTTGDGDPFSRAFDFFFDGPFDIGPGGTLPRVPAIDLSASRFGVVVWEGDEALRLGGPETPVGFAGPITGVPGTGTASPVLFATSFGQSYSTARDQPPRGPYPVLAVFQNGLWRRHTATELPIGTAPFTDVAAVSPTEAYLTHQSGFYTWNGTAFTRVSAVTDPVVSVGSAVVGGAKLVIAGTSNGAAWIGNGQAWARTTIPGAPTLNGGVCITGPGEAFAASSASGGLYRFDGTTWTSVPSSFTGGKTQLQCPAPGQAFVATQGGVRLSWNGSTWVTMPTTGLSSARTFSWAVVSPTEIYAAGDSANSDRAFFRFNGTSWQEIGRGRFAQPLNEPWADPRGAAYFGSQSYGRVEKASGSAVSVISYSPTFRDVVMTSLASAFVVGHNAFLGRWDGTRWNVDAPPPGVPGTRVLRGVWSDGARNAWAVGNASTILRYDGTAWTVLSDVAKPVAANDTYTAVWGIGSDVWIVGVGTIVHCKSAACTNETAGGSGSLSSVWGTSNTNVFAVGAGGRIIQSNGSAWTTMASPTSRQLSRVAGSSASDVWAVGDSVLLHFDGTVWKQVADTRGDLDMLVGRGSFAQQTGIDNVGLWARGPREAYFTAGYGNVARFTGDMWDGMDLSGYRHVMQGISGLAAGCALGVTESVTDAPSATLWRGIGPTGCLLSPMLPPTSWP